MPDRTGGKTLTDQAAGRSQTRIPLKLGVMGGATGMFNPEHLTKARQLGRAIARSGCVLFTGACPGLPLAAACGPSKLSDWCSATRPGLSLDEHV